MGFDNDRDIADFVADDPLIGYGGNREIGVVSNFRPQDTIRLNGAESDFEIRNIEGLGTQINYLIRITPSLSIFNAGGETNSNGIVVKGTTIGIIEGVYLGGSNAGGPSQIEYY